MSDIGDAKYISLTTYKRDGTPRAAPVWITGSGGTYRFTTGDTAWKTKRLAHDARVLVQECSARGQVKPGAATYEGTGTVHTDRPTLEATERALAAKYRVFFTFIQLADRVKEMVGRGPKTTTVVIELVLRPSAAG